MMEFRFNHKLHINILLNRRSAAISVSVFYINMCNHTTHISRLNSRHFLLILVRILARFFRTLIKRCPHVSAIVLYCCCKILYNWELLLLSWSEYLKNIYLTQTHFYLMIISGLTISLFIFQCIWNSCTIKMKNLVIKK